MQAKLHMVFINSDSQARDRKVHEREETKVRASVDMTGELPIMVIGII